MLSTTEGYKNNSPMKPNQSEPTKNIFARKPLSWFSETFDVKNKTAVCRLGTDKEERKKIITGNAAWLKITNIFDHTKIKKTAKKHFTIGFYIITRWCNIKSKMIVFTSILMATSKKY